MKLRTRLAPILAALVLCLPRVLAEGLPDLGESAQADLSPQMERRIGEQIMRDIRWRDPAYVDDPEVTTYLGQIGTRLAAASPDRPELELFGVRDNSLNAFAMPGGFIGVHTGLLIATQSESELAGVLGHEIAHVTQHHIARMLGKQSQASMLSLATILVGILAARSNAQVAQAAIAGGMAAGAQTQLNYSRDFEREADRVGFQTLENAGFDVRGMPAFFERLQKFSRLYENNAPAYLRTHPLTTDRISDMENRAQQRPARAVPDTLEFQLVRAKLRVQQGPSRDAVTEFETQLRGAKPGEEVAPRYGLARARLADRDAAGAEREFAALRKLKADSPLFETLAAEIRQAQGDAPGALRIWRESRVRYPQSPAILYGYVEALLAANDTPEALRVLENALPDRPQDGKLYSLMAKSHAAQGKRLQQHKALAELYALQGQLAAAIDQLQVAQKAGDGDFYEHSAVDARLRELKARHMEELKQKR